MRSVLTFSSVLSVAAVAAACTSSSPSTVGRSSAAEGVDPIAKVPQPPNAYTLFESLQVRPLALSPNGKLLFALNTPDDRLEIFAVRKDGLDPVGSVAVGLEPVAVAARTQNEIWVVNHLSDSISIVDVSQANNARVVRTLHVGDEPRDIVFAGAAKDRAFVTTAHRGQNSPDDPDLFAKVGRADVWVFDANHLGAAPGGERLTKLTLFTNTPRALAASADGTRVYAAGFQSGNQTTVVSVEAVQRMYPNGMPGPAAISIGGQTLPQPPTGLVVKWKLAGDGSYHWVDAYGTVFDPFVRVSLPDEDVFAIDATANPPAPLGGGGIAHVGTTLFNMAVSPTTGKVYVSNTEAHNDVRFEGHTPGFTSVRGNAVDSRITVVDPTSGGVKAADLNSHLDHVAETGDASLSVAFPQDLVLSSDGSKLYVVAQGSSKLAMYDTAALDAGNGAPSAAHQVVVTGGGPTGVALDEKLGVAFVLTRFDDGISIVDLSTNTETAHVKMFDPEPASVTQGRQFLYDATKTSKLGDQACASCHVGADNDGLAWDLGNPGGGPLPITTNFSKESDGFTIPKAALESLLGQQPIDYVFAAYQPSKGPMTTQSLRGLDNHGPMHWRGDRNGAVQQTGVPFLDGAGNPVVSAQPNAGIFDELAGFKSFDVAFPGLVGNATELSDGDMTAFATFALQITYPPNPIRNLDDSLTPLQQAGAAFFFNHASNGAELPSDRFHACNGCHVLDRNANAGSSAHPGFFGTDGRLSFENESQIFKVPHLRNMYQKLGMYGSALDSTHAVASVVPPLNPSAPSVSGFGYQHDGATATLEHFFTAFVFLKTTVPVTVNGNSIPPNPFGVPLFADPTAPLDGSKGISTDGLALRRALAAYVLAFDTNMRPVVGQQITLDATNGGSVSPRIALLEAQAAAGACDLVVRGRLKGRDSGFVFTNGAFTGDTTGVAPLSDAALRALVGTATDALTFTCAPPGSGWRLGVDRDADGYADGDELAAGTSVTDPTSHP